MGLVFEARRVLGRRVAVKRLKSGDDASRRASGASARRARSATRTSASSTRWARTARASPGDGAPRGRAAVAEARARPLPRPRPFRSARGCSRPVGAPRRRIVHGPQASNVYLTPHGAAARLRPRSIAAGRARAPSRRQQQRRTHPTPGRLARYMAPSRSSAEVTPARCLRRRSGALRGPRRRPAFGARRSWRSSRAAARHAPRSSAAAPFEPSSDGRSPRPADRFPSARRWRKPCGRRSRPSARLPPPRREGVETARSRRRASELARLEGRLAAAIAAPAAWCS